MPQITPSQSKRSGTLDLLRFFAVLCVFFAHYTDTFNYLYQIVPSNQKWNVISRYGSLALMIFFMVSGYVVTMTSMNRNIKEFTIARLSRIYPLFWISCLVAFVLPRIVNHSFLSLAPVGTFLANLTMVPTLLGYPLINPVFHTLVVEIIFYLFVAFIIVFKLWNRILLILTLILAYCVVNSFKNEISPQINLLPVMAGILFYFININYAKKWKLYSLLIINLFCMLMFVGPITRTLNMSYTEPDTLNIWVVVIMTILIYVLFLMIALKKIHINSRPLIVTLSEIAYAFYLFHIYFLVIYYYFRNTIQGEILLLLLLTAVLISSYFINRFIEKPLSTFVSKLLYQLTDFAGKKKKDVPAP
ncbi:acyltransferase family protein [Pedobacter sp. AW31-3R]|uniref:acyltransferase family protein n=1 Tax=Pedobacter sp. AW31-3R TaxID=3445781 RepID=UPI003F9F3F1B